MQWQQPVSVTRHHNGLAYIVRIVADRNQQNRKARLVDSPEAREQRIAAMAERAERGLPIFSDD